MDARASGSLRVRGLVEEACEPCDRVCPAVAMELPALLRFERLLIEDEIRSLAYAFEAQHDQCLLIIRVGLLPGEREDEPAGRLDDTKHASKVKGVAVRRLHGDSVTRSLRDVELKVRNRERLRPPPLPQFV